ncbi:Kazal-type serine protease inhibitor-like protein [Algoriphagus ratkowskyi]|uniref:Kazal-type serine protease inhibitor family protein n=1 Tax=Algoriphagus ratkowskyi TaxID=57028 RepID=A0A2W7RT16_9BACT|nr:Kazal-type serine protease inhibitor domain-containing protein [Algoriphagus ratkowskyi]PZX58437.1 Kazal-type serine protease inhibitor-like protein [Algoriphagus ratkowskyi]TXD77696.1 Kazal-type serine protease inhibitor family protein [Algoriphagus ratkowskyi]
MNFIKNTHIGICLLFIFGCEEEKPINRCIDTAKIKNGACTFDYNPVCGCDGMTYSNQCIAENSGVTSWSVGNCK